MKSLRESLFDKDLVQKEISGHQLKDLMFFDGQIVYRVKNGSHLVGDGADLIQDGIKGPNILEIIDWGKVKKDLKKWDGNKIDLGLYGYVNSGQIIMRNAQTNKKTEDFARLILSIPFIEEYHFDSYNSRFRDEFEEKLTEYILPQWRNMFYWNVACFPYGCEISILYKNRKIYLKFEFLKSSD